jgi:hypothetical protein
MCLRQSEVEQEINNRPDQDDNIGQLQVKGNLPLFARMSRFAFL